MEPLFSTHTSLEFEDYKRYVKRMQKKRIKNTIITIAVSAWVLFCSVLNIRGGQVRIGLIMIAVVILWPLFVRYIYFRQLEKNFEKIREMGGADFDVDYYEDHIETKTKAGGGSYQYKKLYNIIETDQDYYIELEAGQCLIVQKKNCSGELISFIEDLRDKYSKKTGK